VRGVDLEAPEFAPSAADELVLGNLRDPAFCADVIDQRFDEVYQLAADMGGAGYIFTGDNDADVMYNSATINLNVVDLARRRGVGRLFYSSSACIYPERNQLDPDRPDCSEASAYPAAPDSEYGWEKLWSERLYLAFQRNHGVPVRIARFHNIFGPEGTWRGGREKSPAAICRKVAAASDGDSIEIWGDGSQTRSFLYIDECVEGVRRLVDSDFTGPVNLGSEEKVSIDQLALLVIMISGKRLTLRHVPGPQGVRGRSSDNRLLRERLGWEPTLPLRAGLEATYAWIERQVRASRAVEAER
jgi:nucleoside-diphosphate-sugar epimerase